MNCAYLSADPVASKKKRTRVVAGNSSDDDDGDDDHDGNGADRDNPIANNSSDEQVSMNENWFMWRCKYACCY